MKIFYRTLSIYFVVGCFFLLTGGSVALAHDEETLRVVVVGDTGIGERAHASGFQSVQRDMRTQNADAILHLGDFVYQPKLMPAECPERYIEEIKNTLAKPYPVRIFVAGDNDLPPHKWKPKASGCWDKIAPLATPFDQFTPSQSQPGPLEGVMHLGPALFVVLDIYDWQDPAPWLQPLIQDARRQGQWVVVALHEPPMTTAWYKKKRLAILQQINRLGPDLVFSGNQHSYERFSPVSGLDKNGELAVIKQSTYEQGTGVSYIVSGGGGATFKPFADQQGVQKRTPPQHVFDALAVRSLMFHYIVLEFSHHALKGTTFRVCPAEEGTNPRWHAGDSMWQSIALGCDGQAPGVQPFDRFEITKKN